MIKIKETNPLILIAGNEQERRILNKFSRLLDACNMDYIEELLDRVPVAKIEAMVVKARKAREGECDDPEC